MAKGRRPRKSSKHDAPGLAIEVREAALKGAGFTENGLPLARLTWDILVDLAAHAEHALQTVAPYRPSELEHEVERFVRAVLSGVMARKRYEAAIKARRSMRAKPTKRERTT